MEKAHIRLQNNPNARLKMNVLKETARETRIIINTQFNILIQLRGETQQLLNIYDRFGLTSIDAMGLSTGGEGYLQEKIKEIKETIIALIQIIKEEIQDEQQRRNVFGKMTNYVKTRSILRERLGGNGDENAEFRI